MKLKRNSNRCGFVTVLVAIFIGYPVFGQSNLVTLSPDGCGRATAYSKTNKIVTVGTTTHVSWLDSDDSGFKVRIRSLNNSTNVWSKSFDVGSASDNHGGPALAVDGKGFLHIVYGPHHGPMSYRKSVRPNDASEWQDEIRFGDRLTYPTLMVTPDNSLILVCRKSYEDRKKPWCVVLHRKKPMDKWSKETELMTGGQRGYSQFHVSLAWGPKHETLHLASRMYGDTPRWGYKVGYMKSLDQGKSWLTYSDDPIALPATRATIETIHETPEDQRKEHSSGSALAGGLVAVDSKNIPHVLYHSLQEDGKLPHQAWIATPDGKNGWSRIGLNKKISVLPEGASLSTPGGFSISKNGNWNLVFTMTLEPDSPGAPFGSNRNEVVLAKSPDSGRTFDSIVISKPDDAIPNWLPSIERNTGFNLVDNPAVIFTSGPKGKKLADRLYNYVYWFRPINSANSKSLQPDPDPSKHEK